MLRELKEILAVEPDRFKAICLFYQVKNKNKSFGLFSCFAAENFPNSWLKACETGVWSEDGVYGDNFREVFNLKKS